ncbi:JAB domain-containing protein [Cytobacillus praedii]|uniref:DNA repair protein RadC n=1 Tax=Cytobacillus praedii TaxID=1742358 RepID=A0A4V2NTW7_9BACI|nr:JAB domain-containing protein [Cytobacillus praedii]TCJ01967.1 DNA repair protein RadC [Cytobacillus praedii]
MKEKTKTQIVFEVVKIKQIVRKKKLKLLEKIDTPAKTASIVRSHIGNDDREVFLIICLNANLKIIAIHRCHVGTVNSVNVSIGDVFKTCLLNNASTFIVAHNHPSCDATPSPEDIDLTRKLIEAGEILNIPLQDHIIVTQIGDYTSIVKEYISPFSRRVNL